MLTPAPKQDIFADMAGLPAFIAAIMVLYATSLWGPAISNDSFSYLVAAHNLAHGNGLALPHLDQLAPMTAWPPAFSTLLSLLTLSGIELAQAARFLNTSLMAADLMLIAWLIRRATSSPFAAFIGTAFLAFSPTLLRAYAHVWSEPLFFLLLLTGLSLLIGYVRAPSVTLALLFGAVSGISCLARYAGISLVLAGLVTAFAMTSQPPRRKLAHALAILAPGVLPLALWLLRNAVLAGNATSRSIAFRIPDMADVRSVLGDMSLWLLPKSVSPTVRTVAMVLAAAAFLWLVVAFLRSPNSAVVPRVMLIFIACYESLILSMCVSVDPAILAEERIQLPVLVTGVIFVVSACVWLLKDARLTRVAALLACLIVAFFTYRAITWSSYSHINGQGFASAEWAACQTVQQVRHLPADAIMYSNSPQLVYAQTGRISRFLPSRTNFTGLSNPRWQHDMEHLRSSLAASGGYVVLFSDLNEASSLNLGADLESLTGRRIEKRVYADGVIIAAR
jgi:hypothetical protein